MRLVAAAIALTVAAAACATGDASRYTGDMCIDLPGGKVCGYTVTEICKKADGVMLTRTDGHFCMIDEVLWEFTGG